MVISVKHLIRGQRHGNNISIYILHFNRHGNVLDNGGLIMECSKCKKDRNIWTELHPITRIDNTPNCGSMFHPVKPAKPLVCIYCLGWEQEKIK